MRFDGGIRQVTTPLNPEDLAPLQEHCHTIQFSERLTDDEMRALADFMTGYPDARLRVYGGYGEGSWGFGSDRKNAEAWDLLPLGPKPFNYDAYKARQARRR